MQLQAVEGRSVVVRRTARRERGGYPEKKKKVKGLGRVSALFGNARGRKETGGSSVSV